jgi:hypothetical protein
MVPSRRGAKVLKATKLAKMGDVGYEEEEPQGEGRGESGEGEDLKRSNDESAHRGKRKKEVDQLCEVHRWTVWGLLRLFRSPYIHNVCLYICNSINKSSLDIWSVHRV